MELSENKPIYLQLADQIMDEVLVPGFETGSRVLSVREFATRCGVNANTVMRTYSWLQQEGIIRNQRGIGYFFSDDAKELVMEMRKKKFFQSEILFLFKRLSELTVSPEELKKLYSGYLEKSNQEYQPKPH